MYVQFADQDAVRWANRCEHSAVVGLFEERLQGGHARLAVRRSCVGRRVPTLSLPRSSN